MTNALTVSHYYENTRARATLAAILACAAFALIAANAAFLGLSVGAHAGEARAMQRAETLSSQIAVLEEKVAAPEIFTANDARARGFVEPASLSYATTRPLGRADNGNEL